MDTQTLEQHKKDFYVIFMQKKAEAVQNSMMENDIINKINTEMKSLKLLDHANSLLNA